MCPGDLGVQEIHQYTGSVEKRKPIRAKGISLGIRQTQDEDRDKRTNTERDISRRQIIGGRGKDIIKTKKGQEVLSRWKRVGAPPTVCRGYITGMAELFPVKS